MRTVEAHGLIEIDSWKQGELYPQKSRFDLNRMIDLQLSDRCASDRRQSINLPVLRIDAKMLVPFVFSWMKKRRVSFGIGIKAGLGIGLVQIAGRAGERKISEGICASLRSGSNVINLEVEIEDVFRSPAILATTLGPLCHSGVERVHFAAPRSKEAAR